MANPWFSKYLSPKKTHRAPSMKFLIVGLGNIGSEYVSTRHNIGFDILSHLSHQEELTFEERRLGALATYKHKGRTLLLLKPNTFMNLSGKAVHYWMQAEKIPLENILILVDDLALPFGKIQIRPKGGDAGHNGLKSIHETLGHSNYARLRFGLSDNFPRGRQVDYVLGKWEPDEKEQLPERINMAINMIKSFATQGLSLTMTQYNNQ